MRRPRPHRLTGSVRRLLAAAVLAGLATAFAVTALARPASAAGLNLNLGLGAVNLNLPDLPSLLPTPTPSATASNSAPALPGGTTLPPICPVGCAPPTSNPAVTGNTANATPRGGARPGSSTAPTRSAAAAGGPFDSSSGPGSSATSTVTVPPSVGLAVSAPPPVEQLTPLAGISFGKAPYLWPLFILLDLIAVGAVVFLVRRTWSPTSGVD
ncbi:MAG: hypothetical protein M3Z57_03930 [Candidatus Dormibacteraeota bacterium]|nr:hypothetical protein [Candidatus Dormibacteraeota bacterium]